jgi:hypothetical protein
MRRVKTSTAKSFWTACHFNFVEFPVSQLYEEFVCMYQAVPTAMLPSCLLESLSSSVLNYRKRQPQRYVSLGFALAFLLLKLHLSFAGLHLQV